MALVMCVKDKNTDSFYIASDGITGSNSVESRFSSMRRYSIQKFKNFYVAWAGDSLFFQNIFNIFDFDKMTTPLTKESIYLEFYDFFVDSLVDWGVAKRDDDGVLREFTEDIIFIEGGKAFDVTDVRIHEALDFVGAGINSASYILGNYFIDKMDAKKLAITMIENEIKTCTDVTYPIYIVNSRDDKMEIIHRNGDLETVKLKCCWSK